MNIYKYSFKVKCPNDDAEIVYLLTIKSDQMIMAEDIVKYCNHAEGYQEYIAGVLKEKLGGCIRLVGTHSSVKVITKL